MKDKLTERKKQLIKFYNCLNTADGKALMQELRSICYEAKHIDPNPILAGHNLGLLEVYKQLESWQRGDRIDHE